MPKIVVGYPLKLADTQRQRYWLSAFPRLDLRLLGHARRLRLVRWVARARHHVMHLLDEEGVGGKFEALAAVRLEPKQRKAARCRTPGNAASSTVRTPQWVALSGRLRSPLPSTPRLS